MEIFSVINMINVNLMLEVGCYDCYILLGQEFSGMVLGIYLRMFFAWLIPAFFSAVNA
jgi:hypothetical protein